MAKGKEIIRREFNIFYYLANKGKFAQVVDYRNIATGDMCFIIGSGPSLTVRDLECIGAKGIPCFGTNRLYRIYSDTEWRADYHVICDHGLVHDREVLKEIEKYDPSVLFIDREGSWEVRDYGGVVCPLKVFGSRKNLVTPQFSTDCSQYLYGIGTVTYCCMQLAVYMGFRRIYLLGIDNRYPVVHNKDGSYQQYGNQQAYFSNLEKVNEGNRCGAIWEMNIAYEYAESVSRKLGFRIYNATRGGYLEVFERVRLEDCLE